MVSRLNVLFVHPNWHDYPVFCRRINAEISFGYVRLSGRMKKLRYVNRVLSIVPQKTNATNHATERDQDKNRMAVFWSGIIDKTFMN